MAVDFSEDQPFSCLGEFTTVRAALAPVPIDLGNGFFYYTLR